MHEASFNKVFFELYLLDKRLRVALFDAIERIEIDVRSIIAHEIGRQSEMHIIKKNL
ncbi:MAG: Abi family protein [Desulfovibrio sp.]|nr:Abi family protein [Desulfovibrio sp.]